MKLLKFQFSLSFSLKYTKSQSRCVLHCKFSKCLFNWSSWQQPKFSHLLISLKCLYLLNKNLKTNQKKLIIYPKKKKENWQLIQMKCKSGLLLHRKKLNCSLMLVFRQNYKNCYLFPCLIMKPLKCSIIRWKVLNNSTSWAK